MLKIRPQAESEPLVEGEEPNTHMLFNRAAMIEIGKDFESVLNYIV